MSGRLAGRVDCGWVLTICAVGHPIFPKQQNDSPRDPDVDELQERYMAELQRLWDEWKDVFAKDRQPGEEGELVFLD